MDTNRGRQIRTFLKETCYADESRIGDTDSFVETGVLDSAGFLELVGYLERTFGVSIEDRELIPENMDSVANILSFLDAKQGAGSARKES